jgi:hypothetical protein
MPGLRRQPGSPVAPIGFVDSPNQLATETAENARVDMSQPTRLPRNHGSRRRPAGICLGGD